MTLIIALFCFAALVLMIVAAVEHDRARWHWCPRCRRWHCDSLGTLPQGRRPSGGFANPKPLTCPQCRAWER